MNAPLPARKIATMGKRVAWTWDGEVYITESEPTWTFTRKVPINARWECSLKHWDYYFATVHAPAGWRAED